MSSPFVPQGVSPRPWKGGARGRVVDSDRLIVADLLSPRKRENAAFITHACSRYEELCERLDAMVAATDAMDVQPTACESTDNTTDADAWERLIEDTRETLRACRDFAKGGPSDAE